MKSKFNRIKAEQNAIRLWWRQTVRITTKLYGISASKTGHINSTHIQVSLEIFMIMSIAARYNHNQKHQKCVIQLLSLLFVFALSFVIL